MDEKRLYAMRYVAGATSILAWLYIIVAACLIIAGFDGIIGSSDMYGGIVLMLLAVFMIVAIAMFIPAFIMAILVCLPSLRDKIAFPIILLCFDLYMLFSLLVSGLTSGFSLMLWPLYILLLLFLVSVTTIIIHLNMLSKAKKLERIRLKQQQEQQYQAYLQQYEQYIRCYYQANNGQQDTGGQMQ